MQAGANLGIILSLNIYCSKVNFSSITEVFIRIRKYFFDEEGFFAIIFDYFTLGIAIVCR